MRLPPPPAAWRSRAGAGDGGDSSVSAAHSQPDVDGFLHLTETNKAGRGCNKRRGGRSRPSAPPPPPLPPAQSPHYPFLPHPRGRHSCLYRQQQQPLLRLKKIVRQPPDDAGIPSARRLRTQAARQTFTQHHVADSSDPQRPESHAAEGGGGIAQLQTPLVKLNAKQVQREEGETWM